jgi:hypothetical protein
VYKNASISAVFDISTMKSALIIATLASIATLAHAGGYRDDEENGYKIIHKGVYFSTIIINYYVLKNR